MQSGQRTLIAEHCCAARTRLSCRTCSSLHFVALRQWGTRTSIRPRRRTKAFVGGGYFDKTLWCRQTRTRCAELGTFVLISFCGRLHRTRPRWCDTAVRMQPTTRTDVADDTPMRVGQLNLLSGGIACKCSSRCDDRFSRESLWWWYILYLRNAGTYTVVPDLEAQARSHSVGE